MNPKDLISRFQQMLEQLPLADFSQPARQMLTSRLGQLLQEANLVSREEFEAQTEVLNRTRLRLEELEQRLNALLDHQASCPAAPEDTATEK